MNKVKHVAIIMDGNRRFAKRLMLDPTKGHEYGVKKLKEVLEWCKELKIEELTLYTFSIQNFNRPKLEFDYLMNLFLKESERLTNENESEITKNDIKVKFIGRLNLFPEAVQKACEKLEEKTKNNKSYKLNFCFGYGGREEMTDAIKLLAEDVEKGRIESKNITEEIIENYIYIKSEPDLIIRTGGDKRTSNFLIWQGIYSEWFFVDTKWPEFSKEEFVGIIDEFTKRQRRFGK